MVTLVLIYALIAGVASLRGYKSPLFGACGIILYIILQFPAAAMMPDSSEWTQCIAAAIASVAFMSGLIFLLPTKDPRSEPKESAVPYAVIGVISLIGAFAVAGLWFIAMAHGAGHSTILLGAALLLTGALACFRLHNQQMRPPASQILHQDPRPPVLFLRSFQSDAARVKPWGSGMLPMYPQWMGKSFEEFLAPAMREAGPFIGLGDPEDYLPSLGASKVYQRDDTWQDTVLDFLRRAGLVILLEGDTPGLRWELGQVRQCCSPRSVFLVTPTKKFPRTSWKDFAKLLRETGFEVPSADVGPGAVVGFDDSFQPVVLCQNITGAGDYAKAISGWHAPRHNDLTALPTKAAEPSGALTPRVPEELPAAGEDGFGIKVLGWLLGAGAFLAVLYFLKRR